MNKIGQIWKWWFFVFSGVDTLALCVLKFWGLWLSTVKVTGPIPSVSLLLSYFLFVLLPSLQPISWSKRGDCTLGQGNALSLYVQDAKFLEGAEQIKLQETRSCHRPVKTRPHMVGWHEMHFVIPMPLRGGTNPGRTCSWFDTLHASGTTARSSLVTIQKPFTNQLIMNPTNEFTRKTS